MTLNESHSKVIGFSIIWSSSPDCGKYKSYFSVPEIIEFPTEVGGQKAYAYFYSPLSHTYQASLEERPPLLLRSHGKNTYCSLRKKKRKKEEEKEQEYALN